MRPLDREARLAGGAPGGFSSIAGSLTVLCVCSAILVACDDQPNDQTPVLGDVRRGIHLIQQNGCGACHQIPGVENAHGFVGPPLTAMSRRIYIAGVERNTPQAMIAWLQNPQAFVPGNAMPNMGLSEADARDITAYLYTLR